MALPEPYKCFVEPLERNGFPYCITGSIAAGFYGEPRLTRDLDIVLTLRLSDLARFRQIFPEEDFYVPPAEALITEIQRSQRGMFNLLHHATGYKADLFLAVRDPLHIWALQHRRRRSYDESMHAEDMLWVAPPEYVIIRKLEYFREGNQDKHIRDIRFMLACTELDRDFMESQVARLGLQEQWSISRRAGN